MRSIISLLILVIFSLQTTHGKSVDEIIFQYFDLTATKAIKQGFIPGLRSRTDDKQLHWFEVGAPNEIDGKKVEAAYAVLYTANNTAIARLELIGVQNESGQRHFLALINREIVKSLMLSVHYELNQVYRFTFDFEKLPIIKFEEQQK